MAREEHLKLLRSGREAWNNWRDKEGKVSPDLENADLSGIALININLIGGKLRGANLSSSRLNDSTFDGSDLRKAILRGVDLRGASLRRANLAGADLAGANLGEAKLRDEDKRIIRQHQELLKESTSLAVLSEEEYRSSGIREAEHRALDPLGCDLREANLTRANIIRTNLSGADLSNANLSRAKLIATNLSRAVLRETNFSQAKIGWVTFGTNDLSSAKGLISVTHAGPSSLGIDTIYNSRFNIPEAFLRGCGVHEGFLSYMHSRFGNETQFYSCFISYAKGDQRFAERLHTKLQNSGVRCWFAPEDLKIGEVFRDKIYESIKGYDKLLLILSESSVTSQWVGYEVEAALERETIEKRVVLFPIQIDDALTNTETSWALAIRPRHIGDFRKWKSRISYQKAFERLLRDLKAEA